MIFEPIIVEELERKAKEEPTGRVSWSAHDSDLVAMYYGRGAITCDDLRRHLDYKGRSDTAIGIEAGRRRREAANG